MKSCFAGFGADQINFGALELTFEAGLKAGIHLSLADPWNPEQPAGMMVVGSSLGEQQYFSCILPHYTAITAASQVFHMLAVGDVRNRQLGYSKLTRRERECLNYVAEGLRMDGIAAKLNISRVTVELHLRNARRKLDAVTLAEAVAKALVTSELRLN